MGYLVLPPDLVDAFVDARGATDFYSPTFLQAVLADFIREGHFARHIRRIRLVCGQRRAALVEAIERNLGDTLTVLGDDAGMYLTAALPAGTNDRDVAARAAERGVWTPPLSDAYLGESRRRPGLILGYGGTDLPAIAEGIARLRGIVERSGAPASPRRPVRRGGLA
jgi:GntR family transcriptional regulator/MocR family aminotransferase